MLGEEEEVGGQYFTPPLSTKSNKVTMMTLNLNAHKLQSAPDQRPEMAKNRAQKAKAPK